MAGGPDTEGAKCPTDLQSGRQLARRVVIVGTEAFDRRLTSARLPERAAHAILAMHGIRDRRLGPHSCAWLYISLL